MLEIAAGLAVGPSLAGITYHDEVVRWLGLAGVLLLLFRVGIESDTAALRRVGGAAARVALIGLAAPMILAYTALRLTGIGSTAPIFLAAAIGSTSVDVSARVFSELGAVDSGAARTVLGAAVADDVGGLLLLAIMARSITTGRLRATDLAVIAVVATAFLVGAAVAGSWSPSSSSRSASTRTCARSDIHARS